jgi:hypothetical protein
MHYIYYHDDMYIIIKDFYHICIFMYYALVFIMDGISVSTFKEQ